MPRAVQPPGTEAGADFIQSIARGLAVIRALGTRDDGLTIAETAQAAGLTRAGARRILLTLARLGYVVFDDRRYQLTPRILDLGQAYFASRPIWRVAAPVLKALAITINETVSAGVLDGTDVLYVLRYNSARPLHLGLAPGARLPAHASSMGWVLLSGLSEIELADYFRRATLDRLTPRTVSDEAALRAHIAEAAKARYAYQSGTVEEGIAGLSAPLRDGAGRIVAALNISTNIQRASAKRAIATLLPQLQAAAAQIEAAINVTARQQ